jgi:hypothetical protein
MTDLTEQECAEVEQPNWAAREMARVNLGDQRLNRRAAGLLGTLGAKPTVRIPAACKGRAETQAADCFFAQERVTVQEILAPHSECTLERARRHPLVLAIQDTRELDFTGKSEIVGLGPLSGEDLRAGLRGHARAACPLVDSAFLQNFEEQVPDGGAAARALRAPGACLGDVSHHRLACVAAHHAGTGRPRFALRRRVRNRSVASGLHRRQESTTARRAPCAGRAGADCGRLWWFSQPQARRVPWLKNPLDWITTRSGFCACARRSARESAPKICVTEWMVRPAPELAKMSQDWVSVGSNE